jgi:hypothetical protein
MHPPFRSRDPALLGFASDIDHFRPAGGVEMGKRDGGLVRHSNAGGQQ